MSLPRPSLWLRIRSNIGPLTLLSVVTSVAFNRALLARERNEQHRLHRLQITLLQQILSEVKSASMLSSLDEQRRLARRMRALQLDPLRVGFSADVLPSAEEEEKLRRAREATTSWSSALFGSGVMGKIREAISTSAQAVRERGFGLETKPLQQSSAQDEEDERWFRALEQSLAEGSSINDKGATNPSSDEVVTLREDHKSMQQETGHTRGIIDTNVSLREPQSQAQEPVNSSISQDKRRRVYL